MSAGQLISYVSESGDKYGKECGAGRFTRLLIGLSLLSFSTNLSAQSPQDLLAAGRVDQALQILEQQVLSAPTADAYNLLCRAHFELGPWDAGVAACERATGLAPTTGLYHL